MNEKQKRRPAARGQKTAALNAGFAGLPCPAFAAGHPVVEAAYRCGQRMAHANQIAELTAQRDELRTALTTLCDAVSTANSPQGERPEVVAARAALAPATEGTEA